VLSGILFVLITGMSWTCLPSELGYGSGMTCWRRLRDWNESGVWPKLRQVLAAELPAADRVDWTRAEAERSASALRRRARISFENARNENPRQSY
jgi:transposase